MSAADSCNDDSNIFDASRLLIAKSTDFVPHSTFHVRQYFCFICFGTRMKYFSKNNFHEQLHLNNEPYLDSNQRFKPKRF